MDSPATRAFLESLREPVDFKSALRAWLPYEAELRSKTVEDYPPNPDEPYSGLLNPFDLPAHVVTLRQWKDSKDLLMKVPSRRYMSEGQPAIASSKDHFLHNWRDYSGGILDEFPWSNTVVAGGAIEACLAPDEVVGEGTWRMDHFVGTYGGSDIDVFTYGLTPIEIAERADELRTAIMAQTGRPVNVQESRHTFTFDAGKGCRKVQLIKQAYSSPAEILARFDLDCPCALYNGTSVWMSPRALVAMCTLTNVGDFTRSNGPAYEVRLAKYALRGYRVFYPLEDKQTALDMLTFLLGQLSFEAATDLRLGGLDLLWMFSYWMENAAHLSEAYFYVQSYQCRLGIDDYAKEGDDEEEALDK